MTDARAPASTRTSMSIKAPRETLYRACTEPAALAAWRAPGEMTGAVHRFDLRVGGGYELSLYDPASDPTAPGKTSAREDRYTARFLALTPPRRIVEAITFDSADRAFAGEMTREVTLADDAGGTRVSVVFTDIPPGIRPEDNAAGTRSALEQLARYVARGPVDRAAARRAGP